MSPLRERLLSGRAPRHGFGTRDDPEPPGLARPRQVHGAAVVRAGWGAGPAPEADAVLATAAGVAVGVVTADCVPLLLAAPGGRAVAAVHAGWRGMAQGVIGEAVRALAAASSATPERLVAGIGPHIGACCYEVDAPVLDALAVRFSAELPGATRPAREGHAWLDLGVLAQRALRLAGLPADAVGMDAARCTRCDPDRFHSYRRDGAEAGRLVHFIAAADSRDSQA